MDIHKEFTTWALAQGVTLNGIAPHMFPGRGLGILAEKTLEAGEEILHAPTPALRTAQTVPRSISKLLGPTTSVNGLLATELALNTPETRAPWRAVLPTRASFEECMPVLWHASLQALLPPSAAQLLENQKSKISADWSAVSIAFPTLSYELYLYNWLLVSTRTFFYTSSRSAKSRTKTKKPLCRDDCLALVPLADNFNHADVGCEVMFSPAGYRICTDRRVARGEEIYISYGNHSNDFLLAEYGFLLEENRWDEIRLDEMILPLFSEAQTQVLNDAGFLGKFVLDRDTVCYRTQVALRLLCMPVGRWQRSVANGSEDEDKYRLAVDKILLKALKLAVGSVDEKIKQVAVLDRGLASQRGTLSRRWTQIRQLLTSCISRIES
ncbi:hypothetical protein B7494_g7176 [Chlorociboria aeruginascens]|nr:hypothetical protein B7494_g7176 [Chlorociboria aeruginascens]